jgi:flagellar biosynthesis protein FliR
MLPASILPTLTPNYVVILFLMMVRISALMLSTPILGSRTVPAVNKIGLSIILALVMLPLVAPEATVPPTFGYLLLAIGKEVLVGLLGGFAITLIYAALQIVASAAGIQIGFGFSSTVDVNFSGQTPVLDQLFTGMATLIFLSGNFHHQFFLAMQRLFDILPPNGFSFFRFSADGLVSLSSNMFLVALRIALPLIGALLLTDVALAVISRTAPQMNIFFVGIPVKMAIGMFAIIVMLPFVVNQIEVMFGQTSQNLAVLLHLQ